MDASMHKSRFGATKRQGKNVRTTKCLHPWERQSGKVRKMKTTKCSNLS